MVLAALMPQPLSPMNPGTRALALLLGLLGLLGTPAVAHAALPAWLSPLSPSDEQEVLADAAAGLSLDEQGRERLASAAANGRLLVTGECGSSPGPSDWVGEVDDIATIQVSNLSDQYVWLVDLRITGADNHGKLSTAHANLPFLEPHSQAEVTMGCDGVNPKAKLLSRVRATGITTALTPAGARSMAATAARFEQSPRFGNFVMATGSRTQSLAISAVSRVDDRGSARLLMAAILAHDPPTKVLGACLGRAGPEAANGIVDALLEDPPDGLGAVFEAALEYGTGDTYERDKALARLLAPICASLTAAQRRDLGVEFLFRSKDAAWDEFTLGACILDSDDVARLISQLPSHSISADYPLRELSGFIALAPPATFELALPLLIGADPSAGIVDGGLRPAALWRAMAWQPEPERVAALERLIRPTDVEHALPLLVHENMNADQLALFDRVAAHLDELPAAQRGPALLPTMSAASESQDLELIERLFALAEHDRTLLRPLVLRLFAGHQLLFNNDGLATLPYSFAEFVAAFKPLNDCPDSLEGLRRCLDSFEAKPELDHAARTGLHSSFLEAASRTLEAAEPHSYAEARALLNAYLAYGLDIEPIVVAVCAQANYLDLYKRDNTSELEFMLEFAPEHECMLRILDRAERERRRAVVLIVIALAVIALLLAGAVWARRRRGLGEDLEL
jgi:hypothetical protein